MSKDIKYLVLENYIGGNFVPCSKLINSFNPSTGEVYCKVPDSGPEEVNAAVRAAKEAFPDWSAKSPAERSKELNKLADLIEARLEEFALAESKDQGSTATARLITECSAPYCKKLSMELGGKNPAIIFADADMEQCISTTVRSSFSNQGEICLCTRRIFIERGIYPEFLARFVDTARRWKTGVPSDPLKRQWSAHQQRASTVTEGAQVHCGEGVDKVTLPQQNASGYFMLPTIISRVKTPLH